tara:strand:- start:78 stop:560 length:483 start_codon:yes stop_codon:yes gene_type:complete
MIQKEFITKEEQTELITWVKKCRPSLNPNLNGAHRFFNQLENIKKNKLTNTIKKRIIDKFNLSSFENEKKIGDILSIVEDGGFIERHNDKIPGNIIHHRYNLLVQMPESGGRNIYNGEVLDVKERCLIAYRPDLHFHCCEKVIGKKPRINLSFGFQKKIL